MLRARGPSYEIPIHDWPLHWGSSLYSTGQHKLSAFIQTTAHPNKMITCTATHSASNNDPALQQQADSYHNTPMHNDNHYTSFIRSNLLHQSSRSLSLVGSAVVDHMMDREWHHIACIMHYSYLSYLGTIANRCSSILLYSSLYTFT